MKNLLLFMTLLVSSAAHADINMLACEPEWEALAKEIGGEKIDVYSATTALQDPHHIEARPSLIAKARKADMLLCTGAELEIGWLPLLLKKSGNASIQKGQSGHFMATDYVELLNKLSKVDRSMGDVHAAGNPHIQLDPRRMMTVATALLGKMKQVDAEQAGYYQQRYQSFKQRWQQAMQNWQIQVQPLRNTNIIVHHKNWVYLQDWLNLNALAALEPKPGVPPSGRHLSKLLQQFKQAPADMIVYSAYQNPRSANWLSDKLGIPAVKLPSTVSGTSVAKDLFSLYDDIINRLLQAKG